MPLSHLADLLTVNYFFLNPLQSKKPFSILHGFSAGTLPSALSEYFLYFLLKAFFHKSESKVEQVFKAALLNISM